MEVRFRQWTNMEEFYTREGTLKYLRTLVKNKSVGGILNSQSQSETHKAFKMESGKIRMLWHCRKTC